MFQFTKKTKKNIENKPKLKNNFNYLVLFVNILLFRTKNIYIY